jgi:HAD superfamily hydrolase (TIGR01509 family)
MPLTLLFDLDGTMVDTDHLHLAAWNAVLGIEGRQVDAAFYKASIMGFSSEAVTEALFPEHSPLRRAALSDAKETAFRAQVEHLQPTPGLPALLDWADTQALGMAIVTNAPRENAMLLLRGLGWESRFSVVVIGDELARGKPDPLPYLTAMQRLGTSASHSIAFEDSLSGVHAAVAAGVETIGLMTALSEPALRAAGASLVVKDFTNPELIEYLRRCAEE